MTNCAGICYLKRQSNTNYCIIRLSRKILQYRSNRDIKDTLLHEMIHAYLWVSSGSRGGGLRRDGHGDEFVSMMNRINTLEGSLITIYHSFHREVLENKKFIFKCNGPCQYKSPYYGIVCRSMNRRPQKADYWFKSHQQSCGGTFERIDNLLKCPICHTFTTNNPNTLNEHSNICLDYRASTVVVIDLT